MECALYPGGSLEFSSRQGNFYSLACDKPPLPQLIFSSYFDGAGGEGERTVECIGPWFQSMWTSLLTPSLPSHSPVLHPSLPVSPIACSCLQLTDPGSGRPLCRSMPTSHVHWWPRHAICHRTTSSPAVPPLAECKFSWQKACSGLGSKKPS